MAGNRFGKMRRADQALRVLASGISGRFAWTNDAQEDEQALDRMKQYLIDQFNEEDNAAWQQAKDMADKWDAERQAADSEFHEAEHELNEAEKAANRK